MDNQQLSNTVSKEELAWFAGFIDGEGCISLRVSRMGKRKNGKQITGIISGFEITNTQKELIDKCWEIANKLGVTLRLRSTESNQVKKTIWKADTHRQAKVRRLLQPIIPYLIGKKERANLVVDFINSRMKRCMEKEDMMKEGIVINVPYTDYEIELAGKVKCLNGRGSSETIRMALTN